MTDAPAPDDYPKDPSDYRVRRGWPLAFWVAISFGLLCILAGFAIGRYGPALFPPKTPAAAASPGGSPAAPASESALTPSAAPAPGAAATGSLNERLDRLESGQARLKGAAAEALAAADLSQAAATSRPFADELAALQRLAPDSADLRALAPYAQAGAPSRTALAKALSDLDDRLAVAARTPSEGSGALARVGHVLAAVFTIRRIDRLTGNDPDAVLARAQAEADDGDLEGALADIDRLPPAGRDAAAGWRARAQRRVDLDRLVAAVRTDAERGLAQAAAPAS